MLPHIILRILAAIGAVVVAALVWAGVVHIQAAIAGERHVGPSVRIDSGRVYAGEVELARQADLDALRHRFERHTHGGRGTGSAGSAVGSAAE